MSGSDDRDWSLYVWYVVTLIVRPHGTDEITVSQNTISLQLNAGEKIEALDDIAGISCLEGYAAQYRDRRPLDEILGGAFHSLQKFHVTPRAETKSSEAFRSPDVAIFSVPPEDGSDSPGSDSVH